MIQETQLQWKTNRKSYVDYLNGTNTSDLEGNNLTCIPLEI